MWIMKIEGFTNTKVFLAVFCLVFLIGNVSASIEISQPAENYNLGDSIYTTVTLNPVTVSGSFKIDLTCNGLTENLYKISPAEGHFTANNEQKVTHTLILTPEFIESLSGSCIISSSLGDEKVSTKSFTITKEVNINASLNKISYNPGESMTLNVHATKLDGSLLNGFLQVSGAKSFNKAIENGEAVETFSMPETSDAGNYELSLFVYDKDKNGEVLNSANKSLIFTINQIPSSVQVSLSDLEATPGEEYGFGLDLFDQAGKKMNGVISVTLVSPNNDKKQLTADSGTTGKYRFATNSTPGKWKLIASYNKVSAEKEFSVKAVPRLDFEFLESVLIIRNIGNDVYNKSIDINIGNEVITLDLVLNAGESKKYNLNAPTGDYNVKVNSDSNSVERSLSLTGNAISVEESSGIDLFSEYPVLWIFIILLLVGFVALFFFKLRANNFFKLSDKFSRDKPEIQEMPVKKLSMLDIAKPSVEQAEASLVQKGDRGRAAVVSVKIKNSDKLGQNAREELIRILSYAKEKKGMIDWKGDYIMIIFSSLVTRTYKNEILASKVAFDLMTKLNEYNKKFNNKIMFGIGVNAGDIISSVENGKLKYTSLGNTVILSKRVADLSNENMLVSEEIRGKLMRDLKVEKVAMINNKQVYIVNKITDLEGNQEKLRNILDRMKS